MSDGTQTLTMKEALAQAKAEADGATSTDADPGVPPVEADASADGEPAPSGEVEQPTADIDGFEVDASGLADLLNDTDGATQNGSGSGILPGSDEFWAQTVAIQTVNGQETVSIQDLSDGYLRHADYTKKTQSLAERNKNLDRAVTFLEAFETDPEGFTRSLAVQAGYLDEGSAPVKDIAIAKIPTQDEIDTKLNELLEERVASDPRVQSAEMRDAQAQVDTEFARLEKAYNVPLSESVRESIIQEAVDLNTSDIEGLLTKRIVRAQQKQAGSGNANLASTARPGAAPTGGTTPEAEKTIEKPSMRQAYQLEKARLAAE